MWCVENMEDIREEGAAGWRVNWIENGQGIAQRRQRRQRCTHGGVLILSTSGNRDGKTIPENGSD